LPSTIGIKGCGCNPMSPTCPRTPNQHRPSLALAALSRFALVSDTFRSALSVEESRLPSCVPEPRFCFLPAARAPPGQVETLDAERIAYIEASFTPPSRRFSCATKCGRRRSEVPLTVHPALRRGNAVPA
jgi:hypothetical protein